MPESIAEFIAKLEKLNFSLVVEERKLILKGDKKKLSKEEIQAIRSNQEIISFIVKNKEELIEHLSQFSSEKKTKDISSLYRLSSLQQGILFHSLYYDKDSGAYIKTFNCDLSGVNPEFFEMAWNFLVKRHSILRTAFYHDTFNIPVQSVFKDVYLPVAWHDCRNLNSQEQKDFISNLNATEMADGFDLKKPPLMRLSMIRINDLKYHLMWKWHDILFDGWSLPVLMEEFLTTYELLASGKKIVEQDEDLYEDYIKYIDRTDKEQSKQYWQKYLDGLNQGTLLPFVESTAERNKGLGKYKTVSLQISTAFTSKIQTFAQKHHITVNTVMQGVWSILLHEYTGNHDIAFGVIVSGRPDDLPGVEKRVGMFINNLPLRSKFDGNESASAWLKNLQSEQVLSRKNQHTPLTDIQNWSGISGDIFDSILVYENYPVNKIIHAKQWRLLVDNIEIHEQTNYPMTLLVSGIEQLSVDFSYNSGLIDEYYVKQISRHFENVLHQIIKKEHAKLSDIDLITASESEQLLETFNQSKKSYPQDQTIVELFEQQVKRSPQATAIIFEDQILSYQELNEKSNQLAHYLKAKGVKPETLVPICLERSVEMMIGILGILKSGGAYVPIDPQYPQDRMAYMLNDCNSAFLLTTEKHTIKTQNVIQQINLKTAWKQIESYPNTNLKPEAKLKNLAYVIYTSGSTGKPKGVMNQHSGLLNRLLWAQDYYKLSVEDKVLQKTTFCFDVSVWELLWPLISGSQLIFAKPEGHKDQQYLKQIIEEQKITMLHFVPSMLEIFLTDINPSECKSLKKVLTSGEALKPSQVKLFKEKLPGTELHNLYGPTEAAIDVTYWSLPEKKKKIKLVPIGKPVSNTQILILNSANKLVPVGCEGEIHIGGVQVARGYLNNETLTKEKFIINPFDKSRRLYKTGDKGRWLSDGNIEYLGRLDDQLKIRGFRIEPGEIESAIAGSKLTKQSVVIAKADQSGSKRLIAYVVGNKMYQKQELLNYLRSKLPDYMIPSVIMELASIPLTANGKVDKRALPEVEHNQSKQYVAPSNEMQRQLCVIWQELLELKQVGITDNFFELGGHSLLAMRVISLVRRQLGIELRVKDLFKYPSIAELSKQLSRQKHGTLLPAIDKQERPAHIPLSFSQERLWFIDQLEGSIQYHIPAVLELKGKLNIEALNFGFKEIINRHEILRTSIVQHQGQAYQQIHASLEWQIEQIKDYKTQTQAELESSIKALINQPYDLSKDSMLRAYLIERTDQDHILVVTLHHIVSDGWSTSIIVNELAELYRSFEQKVPVLLKTLQIQYADYAIWQRNYIQGELLDTKLAYWKQKLQNASPLELPTDYARPAVQGVRGLTEEFEIEASLTQQIKQLSQNSNTTVFMTLLSAFKVMLYRYTNQQDITVGTPIAGRQQLETESLIGYFVNTLALRSDLSSQTKFSELLAQVRTTTLEAYEHQEIPFEKVVEAVVKERDLSRSPLFQVMFVMNNTPEVTGIKLGDVETTEYRFKNDMTQFDLSMTITQINGKMDASIEYCTDLYKTGSIRRMVQHYLELLKSIVQNPDKEVGGLRMLSYTEQNQILREFNTTATAYPQDKLVTELFETQAAASPQKIALSFENEQISYQELNAKSNQLAHYLRQRGAKAEMLIPICLERGPKMIIGILGILKSGAAYVPIDSDYPQSRISYILNDTEARLVVSDSQIRAKIIGRQTEIIDIESDWSEIAKQPQTNLERTVGLNNLAYLIYTSGSTGEPKGVMIEHKSMLNYVLMFKEYFSVSENDYVLQQYSIAFDASLEEIFPTLITGATLGIIKEGGRDIETIKENIENNKATILSVTPAILEALNKRLTHTGKLRYVTVGGDVLQDSAISSLRGKVNIVNGYGPSEATIAVTLGEINAQPEMVNSQARTVKKMFEAQVRATPDLPAVSFNGKQLTYFELNEKANKLANYLIKQGVKSESLIPILINRSFEMIIGILGIMKSGAAYVPINTNFPLERIKNILNDLQCELVLSNHEFGAKISSIETLKIIELDREWAEIEHCSNANLIGTTHPSKLAYVIYTSGSTGKPKGVMIEHQGVVNLIRNQLNYFAIAQGERILQFSDYSFDASVEQIFLALTSGSTLVLFEEGLQFKPDDFEQFIVDEKITHLHTTPGFLENLRITDHRYLKRIIAGGDVCKQELADYWKGKLDFYNEYGPTETTVTAIEYSHPDFEKNLYRSLPIGKGVSNTSIYILGADYQIQPIGVTGEICIGGVQVARGYLNNDAITKEKFISNPFSKDPTARLYKTGDLGRWLEDGNIEFLGRIDEQVKIRGYRIELGEIENVLNQSGLVNQAVIMAKLNHQNSKQLVGYIEPKAVFSKERIIAFLRGKLPEYMVPAIWVEMKKIPVTLNGKIDRKALPDPNFEELSNEHYIAPRNEIEEELANIWKDLLGLEKVGVYDNFFELGGDSILTIQVVSRAGRLGYNLQAKDLFLHQTIHKLSHILTERKETESLAEQGVLTGNAGLLPIQKWFFSKEHKDVSHYNQSVILKLNKAVSEQKLSIAMNKILEAHDALRFKYVKQKLEWIQTYSDINSSIMVEDLSQLSKDDFEFSLNVLAESYQKSLDIEQGELVKWIFIKTPQEDDANRFIMIVHHLAIDGVSWRIILEDLDLTLRNLNLNETDKEVKKTSSYRQWYDELMRLGQTDRIKNQFNYWQNVISFYSPLTFENVSKTLITAKDISRFSNFLSQTQTDHLLHQVSKAYNTEINDILLLAFAEVFTRFSKSNDLVIGLEGHGRELEASSLDISRTVGWFTNLYPVHLNIGNETNIGENIKSIKEQLRQVPAKGMGFGILKYLNELDELKGNDPWDIVFNYLGQLDNTGANSEWFKPSAESIGSDIGEEQIINEKISLNCYVHDGKLIVNWNYSKLHFEASIIKDFAEQFISNLEKIISHCLESQNQGNTSNTPSDFGLGSQVSIDELDRFLNERL